MSAGQYWFQPCESIDKWSQRMTWKEVPAGKLHKPLPRPDDITEALHKIKPTVSKEDIQKYKSWTDRFGSLGS
jgi:SpoVK/Ycf46/Vps4 family AAA+-type ATPase